MKRIICLASVQFKSIAIVEIESYLCTINGAPHGGRWALCQSRALHLF